MKSFGNLFSLELWDQIKNFGFSLCKPPRMSNDFKIISGLCYFNLWTLFVYYGWLRTPKLLPFPRTATVVFLCFLDFVSLTNSVTSAAK